VRSQPVGGYAEPLNLGCIKPIDAARISSGMQHVPFEAANRRNGLPQSGSYLTPGEIHLCPCGTGRSRTSFSPVLVK
jgi:hypothetical protein